jgi:cytidylate kinase
MVITIDGPAGTGKSSVALAVAERLGFDFLDTGAMYRAIGLAALRREAKLDDPRELTFVARHAKITFDWAKHPPGVFLNGEPVGHLLRGSDATRAASYVAVVPAIREQLVAQQQQIGRERGNLVTEGRDQGTVVFPQAELKFYLDASPAERARRRVAQLRHRGEIVDYQEILSQIVARDHRDASRSVGPLAVPKDAETVDTTTMTQDQVIEHIVSRAAAARSRVPSAGAQR